jgi:hypothetical protein
LAQCQRKLEYLADLVETFRQREKRLPVSLRELGPKYKDFIEDVTYTQRGQGQFRLACVGLSHAYEGLQPGEPSVDSSGPHNSSLPPTLSEAPSGREAPPPPAPPPLDGAASVHLGICAFFFILFVLWPYDTHTKTERDSGWKVLNPQRGKN